MRVVSPVAPIWVLSFVLAAFAGCVGSDLGAPAGLASLEVYEFRYDGDDRFSPGTTHGWMMQVTNPTDAVVEFRVQVLHPTDTPIRHGPATDDGWVSATVPEEPPKRVRLNNDTSVAYLFQADLPAGTTNVTYALQVLDAQQHVIEEQVFQRRAVPLDTPQDVAPGDIVRTATVGVYSNGTSFYTNIRGLYTDDAFPYWVPPADDGPFDDTPLSIYVYDTSSDERPDGTRDRCHGTTISGYNALLKTQTDGSTGVRWLAPDEAYTLDGYEDRFLYGHDLIFLNTIVGHQGATGMRDDAPDPTGDCFQAANYSPVAIPDPPSLLDDAVNQTGQGRAQDTL